MKTGVIIGSAVAGAVAGAVLTLDRQEKGAISNFFSGLGTSLPLNMDNITSRVSSNVNRMVSRVSDTVSDLKKSTGKQLSLQGTKGRKTTKSKTTGRSQKAKTARGKR